MQGLLGHVKQSEASGSDLCPSEVILTILSVERTEGGQMGIQENQLGGFGLPSRKEMLAQVTKDEGDMRRHLKDRNEGE